MIGVPSHRSRMLLASRLHRRGGRRNIAVHLKIISVAVDSVLLSVVVSFFFFLTKSTFLSKKNEEVVPFFLIIPKKSAHPKSEARPCPASKSYFKKT